MAQTAPPRTPTETARSNGEICAVATKVDPPPPLTDRRHNRQRHYGGRRPEADSGDRKAGGNTSGHHPGHDHVDGDRAAYVTKTQPDPAKDLRIPQMGYIVRHAVSPNQ